MYFKNDKKQEVQATGYHSHMRFSWIKMYYFRAVSGSYTIVGVNDHSLWSRYYSGNLGKSSICALAEKKDNRYVHHFFHTTLVAVQLTSWSCDVTYYAAFLTALAHKNKIAVSWWSCGYDAKSAILMFYLNVVQSVLILRRLTETEYAKFIDGR